MADEGLLVGAAKKLGKAAGKVAALAGAGEQEAPAAPKKKSGKLAKKNKSRVPRKQKKAQQKTASAKR